MHVRDSSNNKKVDHLIELGKKASESDVNLFEGDLFEKGSYDDAFTGVLCIHRCRWI